MSGKIHLQIFILLLLFLAPLAFAAGISADGRVDESGKTVMKIAVEVPEGGGRNFELAFSGGLEKIVARDRSGLVLQPLVGRRGNNMLVGIVVPVDYVEFEIESDSFTSKSGGVWKFDLALSASEALESFETMLVLPSGATVKSANGAVRAEGNAPAVVWKAADVEKDKLVDMRASYELGFVAIDYELVWFGIAILLAVFIIAYLASKHRHEAGRDMGELLGLADEMHKELKKAAGSKGDEEEKKPKKPKAAGLEENVPKTEKLKENAVFKTLDEVDKEVVREISARGGKTTQAQLYLNLHVPKATLSRRIAALANRGIVQVSRRGNRNLVSLADVWT